MGVTWSEHFSTDGAAVDAQIADLEAQVDGLGLENAELRAQIEELTRPPDKPARGMLVGSSLWTGSGETQQESFDRRTSQWGVEPEIVRTFWPGLPGAWPQYGKAQTVASFKPGSMAQMARGDYDSVLIKWLDSLPVGPVLRVCLWHEREDDIERGAFTKDVAVAADLKLRDLIDSANARNGTKVKLGMVLMAWTLDPRSKRDVNDYLTGDVEYDWLGWDAYPGDAPDQDVPDLSATKDVYGVCRDASIGVPWFICETGTRNHRALPPADYDARQAAWIAGATQIARDLGCKGWMYFDSTVGGDFTIKGPAAMEAMRNAVVV